MEGTLTLCSYGKFGRILPEIAPVRITENCLHKGAEGGEQEGWCEHRLGKEKDCTSWIAMVQQLALHWLAVVIFFLGYLVFFFLQNYVVVIKKKVGGR